jgi:hypothetical protein
MGYPENWEKDCKVLPKPLPEDHIPKTLVFGEKYHLSWASNYAMVWVLKSWNSTHAFLETPRTKKPLSAKIADLREINSNVLKNQTKRLKSYQK